MDEFKCIVAGAVILGLIIIGIIAEDIQREQNRHGERLARIEKQIRPRSTTTTTPSFIGPPEAKK